MSKLVTDDQMRSLWKRRCQARIAIAACNKPIQDQTLPERVQMRRCEREIHWATKDLERGLRERSRHQFRTDNALLILDEYGCLVPVWNWMWKARNGFERYATALMAANGRREAQAIAC